MGKPIKIAGPIKFGVFRVSSLDTSRLEARCDDADRFRSRLTSWAPGHSCCLDVFNKPRRFCALEFGQTQDAFLLCTRRQNPLRCEAIRMLGICIAFSRWQWFSVDCRCQSVNLLVCHVIPTCAVKNREFILWRKARDHALL